MPATDAIEISIPGRFSHDWQTYTVTVQGDNWAAWTWAGDVVATGKLIDGELPERGELVEAIKKGRAQP